MTVSWATAPTGAVASGAWRRDGGCSSAGWAGTSAHASPSCSSRRPWVGELVGIDVDPPRRRLHRASFHLVAPTEHDRIVETITAFNPHVVVHISVWEPHSRANPATARQLTDDAATSILGAAAECRALESVIVRSGIEIYGRARGAPTRPDESADIDPTCDYGEMLAGIERTAAAIGRRVGVTVGAIRMGTVLGPHVPSPLGRVLRMPAVPFSVLADPPFAVVEDVEVARAFVAAARRRLAEPVNVVANGAITALQAARRGRRIPVPARRARTGRSPGRSAACSARRSPTTSRDAAPRPAGRQLPHGRAARLPSPATTMDVIDKLYEWPTVVRIPARRAVALDDRHRRTRPGCITLPVERTLTAARAHGGRRRRARQVAARRDVARRRLGPRPGARRRRRQLGRAALEHGRRRRRPAAGPRRRADRRQRPPLRLAPVSRALALARGDRAAGALRRPPRRRSGRRPRPPPRRPARPARRGRRRAARRRAARDAAARRRSTRAASGASTTASIGAAVETKSAVFPAATASSPWSRSARIEIGPAVRPGRRRRGPADRARAGRPGRAAHPAPARRVRRHATGTPLDWLPLSGMGGSCMTYATAADGVRLHYQVTGRPSGPPVLLIQGLGADKHGWDLQRLALAWTHHTIALDNRGAGSQRQAARRLHARADGRRRHRRARPRRRRDGPRRRRVDGRRDQPDPRARRTPSGCAR